MHAANVQDRDGLGLVCASIRRRFPWLQQLFADAGYQGEIAMCTAAGERLRLEIVKRPRDAGLIQRVASKLLISPNSRL